MIRFSQQENRISLFFLPRQPDEKPPCLPVASAAPRVSCKPIADNSLGRNWTGIQGFFSDQRLTCLDGAERIEAVTCTRGRGSWKRGA